jgi:hypothetical protein
MHHATTVPFRDWNSLSRSIREETASPRFCTWHPCPVSQLCFSALLRLKFIFRFTNITLCASPPEIYTQFHNFALRIYDSVSICRFFPDYVLCFALIPCFIVSFILCFLLFSVPSLKPFRSLSWCHSLFFPPPCFHYLLRKQHAPNRLTS